MLVFNGAMLALAAVIGLVLAVVCLLLAIHVDLAPRIGIELAVAARLCVAFVVMAAAAGLAFHGMRRKTRWRWAAEGAMAGTAFGVAYLIAKMAGL